MNASKMRAGAVCALLATTCLASPSAAQNAPLPPPQEALPTGGGDGGGYTTTPFPIPPEKFATSPGGVDMRTGRYNYQHTDLSIGGDQGLTLQRTLASGYRGHHEMFGGLTHNWDIFLTEARVQVQEASSVEGFDYVVSVYGGRSASFRSLYSPTNNPPSFKNQSAGGFSKLNFTFHTVAPHGFRIPDIYTLTAEDGTVINFRQVGTSECGGNDICVRASDVTEPNGTKYTLNYDSSRRLRNVVSNHGYALLFEYASGIPGGLSGGQQLVSKACALNLAVMSLPDIQAEQICPAGVPTSTYGYTTYSVNGIPYSDLTSFTDQGGVSALIGPKASAIYKAGSSTPTLTNTIVGDVVTRQTFADGRTYSYSWGHDGNTDDFGVPGIAGGAYTDNNNRTVTVEYGFYRSGARPEDPTIITTPSPESITDENGHSITASYCTNYNATTGICGSNLLMKTRTDAEGIVKSFTHDSYRNVTQTVTRAKPGSGLLDLVTSATYPCASAKTCNKPETVTDARRKTTNYTYDPAHGGVLTETGPANTSGTSPVKRYVYAARYAWINNGAGGYNQAASPVYLRTEERTCRTSTTVGNGCAEGAADEAVVSYDYGPNSGPNNLLLRGMVVDPSGLNLRTCYAYDRLGNKISETSPKAGLATCS